MSEENTMAESINQSLEYIKKFREELQVLNEQFQAVSFDNTLAEDIQNNNENISDFRRNVNNLINDIETAQQQKIEQKIEVRTNGVKDARKEIEKKLGKIKEKAITIKTQGLNIVKDNIQNALNTVKNHRVVVTIKNSRLTAQVNSIKNSLQTKAINIYGNVHAQFGGMKENLQRQLNNVKNKLKKPYYMTLAVKNMAKEKISSLKNKLISLSQKPIVIKAAAKTSILFKKLEKLGKKTISPIIAIKDKTKTAFNKVNARIKALKKRASSIVISPTKKVYSKLITPVVKHQKKQMAAGKTIPKGSNVAAQVDKIQKSINSVKGNVLNALAPIITSVLTPIANWITKNQPKINAFIQKVSARINKNAPKIQAIVSKALKKISKGISSMAPIFNKTFKKIQKILIGMQPVLKKVFKGIGKVILGLEPVFKKIIDIVKFLGKVWTDLWPKITKILETAWGIMKPIFSIITSVAKLIVDIFQFSWPIIGKVIEDLWSFIEPIFNLIGDALNGIADAAGWVVDKIGGFFGSDDKKSKKDSESTMDESIKNTYQNSSYEYSRSSKNNKHSKNIDGFAVGISRVPYDDYPALLHEGERVLTKQEVNSSKGFGNISIAKLADSIVVREEADIDKISRSLVSKLQNTGFNMT